MSAFAAIASLDGAPLDSAILDRMAAYLAPYGPDQQKVWVGGWNRNVGLVSARLATTREAESEQLPLTLGDGAWIAGDIRVDAREDLRKALETAGRQSVRQSSDAELILHAYAAWGPDCAARLLGDFSVAVWDANSRRLWCARDQMGVRPLYFFNRGPFTVCSNVLDCVLICPAVPDELSEGALLDFLMFGESPDLGATIYKDVQKLPPAHSMIAGPSGCSHQRYWNLPDDEPHYCRRDAEYGDRLADLLRAAVKDRLRTSRIAVFMSGGLDSSTLAALASQEYDTPGNHVTAHTILLGDPAEDAESRYVNEITRHLGIEVRYRVKGQEFYDRDWQLRDLVAPEPDGMQFSRQGDVEHYRRVSQDCRVVFYGEGPDNALEFEWLAHFRFLAARQRWMRAAADVLKYARYNPRIPRPKNVLSMLRQRGDGTGRIVNSFPAWLRADVVKSRSLRDRWREVYCDLGPDRSARPKSRKWLTNHAFPNMCEHFAPEWLRAPLEFRHPYLDLRVIRFLLAVPAVPWCHDKLVMRHVARKLLPASCAVRPKTPVPGNPWFAAARDQPSPPFLCRERLQEYVDLDSVRHQECEGIWEYSLAGNVYAVDYWLAKHRRPAD